MASNRVSAVLFRVITAALLLFTASYPQAHAQSGLGGLLPGLGGLLPPLPRLTVPPLPLIPNVPLPSLPQIPPLPVPPLSIPSLPVSPLIPNIPLPSLPVPLPPLPVPPVSPLPPLFPTQLPIGLNVSGQLCCAPNGNCPAQGSGQGVGGVPVTLTCTLPNGATTVGGGTTGANGTFSIVSFVPAVGQLVSSASSTGQIPCVVVINLTPLLSALGCPLLSALNGILASLVNVIGTAPNALLGPIANANITGFVLLSA